MGNKTLILKLILEILASDSIDEKITMRNQLVKLFKDCEFEKYAPLPIRLNAAFDLKESIDNYITHDNTSTKEMLQKSYSDISLMLTDDVKLAG